MMYQIKIFRKQMEDSGNGSFQKVEDQVNAWLKKNKEIDIKNMFSSNMFDDYGEGEFVLIILYTDKSPLELQ